jgi:hypothetical protein
MKRIVVIVTALVLLPAAPAMANRTDYPHRGEVDGRSDTSWRVGRTNKRPPIFMVGDSILAGVYLNNLQRTLPKAEVSAVSGRDVGNLPYYINDRLNTARERRSLRTVVIALGSNATQSWTYEALRGVVNRIPARVMVVFVSTYRDPRLFPDSAGFRGAASSQVRYNGWMSAIAGWRKRTYVMPWRTMAQRPNYLYDGVHPTLTGIAAYSVALRRLVAS